MIDFVMPAATLLAIWTGLVLLVRRNLRQRPQAREFRQTFIDTSIDLVGNTEFPEEHARQIIAMSTLPEGWLTRFMALWILKRMIWGDVSKHYTPANVPSFVEVPHKLRGKYILAIFAFLIADTYRCALLGRLIRGTHAWLFDAIAEVKPDVDAHATRTLVDMVNQVHVPKHAMDQYDLVCA